jgi:tryptophan halogenase
VAIAKLLTVFPKNHFSQALIDKFNREMSYEYSSVKDFLIAHYCVTEREDTEFWRYCKHMDIPDSLKARLELFKTRGEVMAPPAELFKETNWFAVLYGQGIVPDEYHPVADVISEYDLKVRLARIRSGVQDRVDGMTSHQAFIDRHCAARRGEASA